MACPWLSDTLTKAPGMAPGLSCPVSFLMTDDATMRGSPSQLCADPLGALASAECLFRTALRTPTV